MQKRGFSHIDWIIGSGLFLIGIITILIFLKPGIIPIHNQNTLLDIVEDNFRKEATQPFSKTGEIGGVYWNLTEIPLYIYEKIEISSECIKVPFEYDLNEGEFDIYKISGDTDDLNNLPDANKESPIPYSKSGNSIIFKTTLLTKDVFIIDASKSFIFPYRTKKSSHENICPPDIDPIEPKTIVDGLEVVNFEVKYGVAEQIKGVSKNMLTGEWEQFYPQIKDRWGYPNLKEFSIFTRNTPDPNTPDPNAGCSSEDQFMWCNFEPVKPGDVNVFTRTWSDFILNYNGIKKPVIITIKVW